MFPVSRVGELLVEISFSLFLFTSPSVSPSVFVKCLVSLEVSFTVNYKSVSILFRQVGNVFLFQDIFP